MYPKWNPTRRNRHIGTAWQGHGQNNRHVIPSGFPENRMFYEHLVHAVAVPRIVGEHLITFLIEPVQQGYLHACTIDDICQFLQWVPQDHLEGLKLVLLRQPTRRQVLLRSVWGRLIYYATVEKYHGHAICLEAQNPSRLTRWTTSLNPEQQKELERLRQDGHQIVRKKRFHEITSTQASIRATQLYRTLPHELGHYVDWRSHMITPWVLSKDPEDEQGLRQRFQSKSYQEREAFAHRYADDLKATLTAKHRIPFLQMFEPKQIEREGLHPEWFQDATI